MVGWSWFENTFSRFSLKTSLTNTRSCSPRKLAGLKLKLISLKDAVTPIILFTSRTNKSHSQCPTLSVSLSPKEIVINHTPHSLRLQVRDFSMVRAMEWESVTTMFQWSTTQSNMSSNR
ncbi:hypothetical protein ACTFIW_000789 [Dictyostelium discoideum]